MVRHLIVIYLFLFYSCQAQVNIKDYQGDWEGLLPHPESFHFTLTIEELDSNSYHLTIANHQTALSQNAKSASDGHIQFKIDSNTQLEFYFNENKEELTGFLKSGALMYHIRLKKNADNRFAGTWDPLMTSRLQPQAIFLNIEKNEDGTFAAYPFFGDQRFSGTWSIDFRQEGDTISFQDFKTGMKFRGKLLEDTIRLDMLFMDLVIATTNLSRSNGDWEFGTTDLTNDQSVETPPQLNDGWITANIKDCDIKQAPLVRMINNINGKKLPNTHSVLITKGNKLVFEAYFHGYNAVIPHDMRSASKSISSAMIGIAIEDNMINGVDQNLYHCLPVEYQYTTGSLKDQISIQDLLTMSSGLDVNGQAAENHYQNTGHWLKTVLESPMKDEPGSQALYGSANPFLLGICLNELVDKPLELYMDQALLSPLGITNYIIQTDETLTTPYFGGGMHLTSRDMLKFGQLYLNRGKWMEKQILSAHWVAESFEKHVRLEDVKDKNEYGYQWWHNTYIVDNEEIESVEARGAGGQYIFVIPALESVAVITSGNFRNGRLLQQPEKILEQYILPAILD